MGLIYANTCRDCNIGCIASDLLKYGNKRTLVLADDQNGAGAGRVIHVIVARRQLEIHDSNSRCVVGYLRNLAYELMY